MPADSSRHVTLKALKGSALALVTAMADIAERLKVNSHLGDYNVYRPHPLLVQVRKGENAVLLFDASVWSRGRELLEPFAEALAASELRLVILGDPEGSALDEAVRRGLCTLLPDTAKDHQLAVAIKQAFELMETKARCDSRDKWLDRYRYELGELIDIAQALTTEREIDRLLDLILEKSRFVSGADAGSLYVVEGEGEIHECSLRFKTSQNDSVSFDSREFSMPISRQSMAGYVALEQTTLRIDDVYRMPADAPFGFDRSFDERVGYRTKSVLATPLVSQSGQVIGVLQLINKKRDPTQKLLNQADVERIVVPFDERSEQLLQTLAAQAGIALENAILYDEIRSILEGFVRASVDAIEQRDPTTSGHSRRVAEMTVALAHAVERTDRGAYKDVVWSREDVREIEYASLLHDFGKIGVRENVLVKAKKLYPHQLEAIRLRFDYVMRSAEADILARKLTALENGESAKTLELLDAELAKRRKTIQAAWETICQANEPTVLAAGDFQRIEELARETYGLLDGGRATLLRQDEIVSLSVNRGTLTAAEYDEIRSHVSHTYRFLSKIPWGRTFSRVAAIAGAHHERLNGTGYPNRLHAEEIPLQSKMMTISDIFDALTASDRPYKKAMPVERAIEILNFEVKDGHVDGELVRIFCDAKSWQTVMGALY